MTILTNDVDDDERLAFGCPPWCDRHHTHLEWDPDADSWVPAAPDHLVDISGRVVLVEEPDGTAWVSASAGRLTPKVALELASSLLQAAEKAGCTTRRGSPAHSAGLAAADALLKMARE